MLTHRALGFFSIMHDNLNTVLKRVMCTLHQHAQIICALLTSVCHHCADIFRVSLDSIDQGCADRTRADVQCVDDVKALFGCYPHYTMLSFQTVLHILEDKKSHEAELRLWGTS